MRKHGKMASCLFFLLSVATATTVVAQAGNASLRGTVTDGQGGVLPGVTITATSSALLGPAVAVTGDDGQYRLINLPPGTYALSAELSGFSTFRREGIVMRAGATFQVDIAMSVGTLAETITVTADSPMLEVSNPSNVLNVDGDFQRQLPLVENKTWVAFLELTPGVFSRSQTDGSGRQIYMGNATDDKANVADFEGLDALTYNDSNTNRVSLSTEAIEDIQIKTGGVEAAAPMGQGLVLSMVGKSGGNRFSGSVGHTLQPFSWANNNTGEGTPSQRRISQTDFSFGGPFRRDRAWFFGAARVQSNNTRPGRTPARIATLRALFPNQDPEDGSFGGFQPFVKLTAKLGNQHTLTGFYQADRLHLFVVYNERLDPDEVSSMGGGLYGTRLTSLWGRSITTTLTAGYSNKGGNDRESYEGRLRAGPATFIHALALPGQGILTGSGLIARTGGNIARGCQGCMLIDTASVPQIRGDLTWYKDAWAGSHEFQTGFLALPSIKFERTTVHLNDGLIVEHRRLVDPNNPAAGTVPFYRQVVTSNLTATDILSTSRDIGLYVQDTWRPTSRLTATLGVRVDFVQRLDDLNHFKIQSSAEIGPRFGFSYLLTKDARNVLRGTYARVHENMQVGRSAIGLKQADRVSDMLNTYDLDGNGTFETVFSVPAASTLSNLKFGDDIRQPMVDEWILGYRRQFPGEIAVDVAGIYRRLSRGFHEVDINGFYPDRPFQPFGGFGRIDPNQGIIYQLVNSDWSSVRYQALQITVSKNLTRGFQALAAFHRQWQQMSGTWNPTDPARFVQPHAFPNNGLVDRPGQVIRNSYPDGGTATMWTPYAIRMSGTWQAPAGVLLSASYSILPGLWSGAIVERLAANDPNVLQFGPATVVSSTGVRQPNPLANRVRFVYPTRGENQVHLPAAHQLGLKAGKRFSLGGMRHVEVAMNVLNLLNGGRGQTWESGANQTYSPNFMKTSGIQPSRAFQLDTMFRF